MSEKTTRAQETMESPLRNLFAVSPSDSVSFEFESRALWVGVGGDIVILGAGDTASVTLKNVASGTLLPIRAQRIDATDTTATDIVGGY